MHLKILIRLRKFGMGFLVGIASLHSLQHFALSAKHAQNEVRGEQKIKPL